MRSLTQIKKSAKAKTNPQKVSITKPTNLSDRRTTKDKVDPATVANAKLTEQNAELQQYINTKREQINNLKDAASKYMDQSSDRAMTIVQEAESKAAEINSQLVSQKENIKAREESNKKVGKELRRERERLNKLVKTLDNKEEAVRSERNVLDNRMVAVSSKEEEVSNLSVANKELIDENVLLTISIENKQKELEVLKEEIIKRNKKSGNKCTLIISNAEDKARNIIHEATLEEDRVALDTRELERKHSSLARQIVDIQKRGRVIKDDNKVLDERRNKILDQESRLEEKALEAEKQHLYAKGLQEGVLKRKGEIKELDNQFERTLKMINDKEQEAKVAGDNILTHAKEDADNLLSDAHFKESMARSLLESTNNHEAEINRRGEEMNSISEALFNKEKKLNGNREELEENKKWVKDKQKELESRIRGANKTKEAHTTLTKEVTKLDKTVKRKKDTISKLEHEIGVLVQRKEDAGINIIKEANNEASDIIDKANRVKKEADNAVLLLEQGRTSLADRSSVLDKKQEQLGKKDSNIDLQERVIIKREKEVTRRIEDTQQLLTKQTQLEGEIGKLELDVSQSMQKLKETRQEIEQSNKTAESIVTNAKKQADKLLEKASTDNNKANDLLKSAKQTKANIDRHENSLKERDTNLLSKEKAVSQLESELVSKNKVVDQMKEVTNNRVKEANETFTYIMRMFKSAREKFKDIVNLETEVAGEVSQTLLKADTMYREVLTKEKQITDNKEENERVSKELNERKKKLEDRELTVKMAYQETKNK